MDFNRFKNKLTKTKNDIKYLFKETIKLFYGNKTHAIIFWTSILGILLVHVFVSSSSASMLKIAALAFFAINSTRIARGLEDMLENITTKDIEIMSFIVVVTEISLGFLMSARYFNGVVADILSIIILSLIFSQYLRYLNNVEYKEYEKELKIDAINNPKAPIIEPLIKSIIEKRENNPKTTEEILHDSKKLMINEPVLDVKNEININDNQYSNIEPPLYSDNSPNVDMEAANKAMREREVEIENSQKRSDKIAEMASKIIYMDMEFENLSAKIIDFEEQTDLSEIEINITEKELDLELSEEDQMDAELDEMFAEIDDSDEEQLEVESDEEQEEFEELEAKIKAENEAKEKLELEAKIKAENEAKEKLELEAKIKAENEAKERLELEAKIKAEKKLKAKEKRESKAKLKKEAKIKAEQDLNLELEQEIDLTLEIPEEKENTGEIEFDLDDLELEFKIESDDEEDQIDERFNILDSDIDLSFDIEEEK